MLQVFNYLPFLWDLLIMLQKLFQQPKIIDYFANKLEVSVLSIINSK